MLSKILLVASVVCFLAFWCSEQGWSLGFFPRQLLGLGLACMVLSSLVGGGWPWPRRQE